MEEKEKELSWLTGGRKFSHPEFKKTMEQRFQIPCEVENDVKSAICTFRERNSRTWEPAVFW